MYDHSFEEVSRLGQLVDNRYGKSRINLLRLDRTTEPHQLFDAHLEITLEGAFGEAYTEGDNRRVLPTDSMKNTVYALARERSFETPEGLARLLARHFISHQEQVEKATVRIVERPWNPHRHHTAAFIRGNERSTAKAVATSSDDVRVTSGTEGLALLKSSGSSFADFPRDRFTLLEESNDRLISTELEGEWSYISCEGIDFIDARQRVRSAMLDAFAEHESLSLQHTLYWMAEAALKAAPEVGRVSLRLPNKHCLLVPLEAVGLDNPNHIFVPTDEPYGMIEGTVERRDIALDRGSPAGSIHLDQAVGP